ncbi:YitT family protein, partial [bacterium]|nr:YitT family protein [bacterium]
MKKKVVLEESFHVFIVLISATVYSLAVMWFITPAKLYSSGVTGFGQIISDIIYICSGNKVKIPLGVFTFVLNVPLFIYGWKKVSIRFAIYSLLSVIVQSLIMMDWT